MNRFPLFLLPIAALILLGLAVPLAPPVVGAQPAETPILGEPVVVTPLITAGPPDEPATPANPPTTAAPGGRGVEPSPTARAAAAVPDSCEPNDSPSQACALPLDAVSGPFTIVPENDQDFFLLDLPQEQSIQTVITVRATTGLDLFLSARQAEQLVASGTYSLTLAPGVTGPVSLRVENRDPRPAAGESYRVEVRREIVPTTVADDMATADLLENNWSFDTAAPIAVGVVYDLSLVCPEARPGACPGGDHDYLRVPVKAGVGYLLATFDLDDGVDTVLELFWNDDATAVAGNDDYAPGGMLSALRWVAPADGMLGVRLAPRNGGLTPVLGAEAQARYRFAVAAENSELARKLDGTIRQQANVPAPTATTAPPAASGGGSTAGRPGGSPPSSGGAAGGSSGAAVQETIAAGPAIIVRETVLRREPREGGTALATLAAEAPVTVRGPVSGLWVSVETVASILPGWVRWSDLQRAEQAASSSATPAPGANSTPSAQQSGVAIQGPSPSAVTTITPTATGPQVNVAELARPCPGRRRRPRAVSRFPCPSSSSPRIARRR